MRRLLVAVLMLGALAGCGSPSYVDAGTSCTKAGDCPSLRCLPDGGMGAPDSGTAGVRGCVFGRCIESCT